MTKTCFITEELFPKDRGGIGRLLHNILQHSKSIKSDADLHVVLPRTKKPDDDLLKTAFADIATLHFLDSDVEISKRLGIAGLANAISIQKLDQPGANGLRVLDAVIQAETLGGHFDHIEIPDHMGLGAVLISAKKSGIAFANAEITCRIHSTLSAIIAHEPFYHARNNWLAPRLEMERQSLRDADRIIAHLPAIADFNQNHFDLPPAWRGKVKIEFPPVIWPPQSNPVSAVDPNADFIFTSRFQPFKRPELFVKAAQVFLLQNPEYTGDFRLISYGFDINLIDDLRLMIPSELRQRIRIETNLDAADRDTAMANGIVVHPSIYESLCALAYEVSTAGRPILLARDCLAFGKNSHWKDTKNCLLFDATPNGLARVMGDALNWRPSEVVACQPDTPYFHQKPVPTKTSTPLPEATILCGPLLSQQDFEAFAKLTKMHPNVEGFANADQITALAADGHQHVHALSAAEFQGTQLAKIAKSKNKPVVFCSPNAQPSAAFLTTGLACIQSGTLFSANSKTDDGKLSIYPGRMPTVLASDHRIAPQCVLIHPDDLNVIGQTDDRNFMQRLVARIAQSDIDLTLCPLPLVVEAEPELAKPPARQNLGFHAAPHWQNGVQQIGIEINSARFEPLLHEGAVDINADQTKVLVEDDQPSCQALALNAPSKSRIIAIKIKNMGENPATVSLHQSNADNAVAAHIKGLQCRKIRAGQSYQMRWGPMLSDAPVHLIATAQSQTELEIENLLLISRE